MTLSPFRPCKNPGCPGLTRDRDGYCDKCKEYGQEQKRKQDVRWRKQNKANPFYGTARWQRFRNWYKRSHPLCEDCLEQDKVVPVYCVDHIKELKDGGAPLDSKNARSLCRKCHARKTVRERQKREGKNVNIHQAGHYANGGNPLAPGHHWNK